MQGLFGSFGRLAGLTEEEIETLAAENNRNTLDNLSTRLGTRGFQDLAPVPFNNAVIGGRFPAAAAIDPNAGRHISQETRNNSGRPDYDPGVGARNTHQAGFGSLDGTIATLDDLEKQGEAEYQESLNKINQGRRSDLLNKHGRMQSAPDIEAALDELNKGELQNWVQNIDKLALAEQSRIDAENETLRQINEMVDTETQFDETEANARAAEEIAAAMAYEQDMATLADDTYAGSNEQQLVGGYNNYEDDLNDANLHNYARELGDERRATTSAFANAQQMAGNRMAAQEATETPSTAAQGFSQGFGFTPPGASLAPSASIAIRLSNISLAQAFQASLPCAYRASDCSLFKVCSGSRGCTPGPQW